MHRRVVSRTEWLSIGSWLLWPRSDPESYRKQENRDADLDGQRRNRDQCDKSRYCYGPTSGNLATPANDAVRAISANVAAVARVIKDVCRPDGVPSRKARDGDDPEYRRREERQENTRGTDGERAGAGYNPQDADRETLMSNGSVVHGRYIGRAICRL